MNELVKQLIDFAKLGSDEGWAMFFIAFGILFTIRYIVVGVVKWTAIAIHGHPPVNTNVCSECGDELDEED